MTSLCTNNEGEKCRHEAVVQLSVAIGEDLAFDVCLTHLLKVMIRHGVAPQKAVDVISSVGHRIALDILNEERQTQ